MPIWGSKPEKEQPERKKVTAPYERLPPPNKASDPKDYLLAQAHEIYTPLGWVQAEAGDILRATDSGLWVLAKEVLNCFGVIVKPKSDV